MPGLAALTRRHVLLSSILASGLLASPAPFARAQAPVEPPAAPAAHHPSLSAASGVLIVEPRRGPDGAAIPESDAQLQRRIQTHVATIASEHHMRRVVNDSAGDVRRTAWFRESSDVNERAAWLRDHCRVTAVPGTSLIEIALPDVKEANERKAIVYAVGGVYLHDANGAADLRDRTAVLQGLRDKVKTRLGVLAGEKQQAQLRLNGDGGVGGRIGAKEIELSKLVQEQIDTSIRAQKAAAQQKAADDAVQKNQPVPGEDDLVKGDAQLQRDQETVQQIEVEVALTRDQFGPNHPNVLSLAKRLDVMREKVAKREAAIRSSARRSIVDEIRAEASALKATADGMSRRVEELKREIGDLSSAMLMLQSAQEEERGLREQIKVIQEQIDHVVAFQGLSRTSDIHWHLLPEAAPR